MKNKDIYITVAKLTLITLVSMTNGKAGAKIITALAQDYLKKKNRIYSAKKISEQSVRNSLYNLKKSGLIEQSRWGIWSISKKGRKFAQSCISKILCRQQYIADSKKDQNKINTIIIFDIPEIEREKRYFLRLELRALNFRPLQKSVWMGNVIPPKSFVQYLRNENILQYIHIFGVRDLGTLS